MHPQIRAGARHERVYPLSAIEIRSVEGQPTHVVGHAAVYNTWSQDLGGFKERVLPGAFSKSLGVSDVRALFNHDPNYILGRTKSGTLTLGDESKGLHFDAIAPETQTIRDLVLAPIARGDIDQCSFSFTVREDAWREPKSLSGLWERDLVDVELYDVSPVTFPAYLQTDVVVRSLATEAGIDLEALTAFLARSLRGLPATDTDVELVTGSIAALQSYLPAPEANGEEPSGANGEEPSRSSRTRLAMDLEHRLRVAGLEVGKATAAA